MADSPDPALTAPAPVDGIPGETHAQGLRADALRNRRQAFAAPGGVHDRLVRTLSNALPAGVGVIVAVMVITPLFPRSEVSFLLDRNHVAITEERLAVQDASYRGQDAQGRAFSISAGHAVQHSARVPIVRMEQLVAHMQLTDGSAQATAPSGEYHLDTESMDAPGPVELTTSSGYRLDTRGLSIDLKQRRAVGAGGVNGTMPSGAFSADRVVANLDTRQITLDGHARLHMDGHGIKVVK